ncbi:MAG TPA: hypothetical protein VM884_06710 [Flavisolibacter sp.]|jgi:hypothetical protein|nr:hypothetical protein [Flavisolibacter sp.]
MIGFFDAGKYSPDGTTVVRLGSGFGNFISQNINDETPATHRNNTGTWRSFKVV